MDSDRVVTITIPDVLRRVLEEDGRNITQRDKFVKLPCEVNVITILENYVKYRAANLLCAAPPKNGNNGKQLMPEDVENKLNLCKEAMDGIRIYFDFTLPHLLLYRHEKKQYYTVGTTCLPYGVPECEASKEECGKIKKELDLSPSVNNECHVPKDQLVPKIEPEVSPPKRGRPPSKNKPSLQQSQPILEASVNGYASSKLRNRTPPSKIIIQKSKRERQPKAQNQRRILRSNDKQKSPDTSTTATATSSSSQDTETNTTPRPESPALPPSPTRQTRKSILNNPSPPAIISSQTKSSPNDKVISNGSFSSQQCSQPPPSLSLMSNGVTSSNSSTHSSLSSPVLNEQQYHLIKNSGLLQEVSSWRMLPEYLYEQVPVAPSLIYGAQHLLRLFVKLPDLISKMNMSRRKLDLLLDILENFLQYLAEQEEELFQPFAYVDSNDVFPDSNANK